MNARTWFYSQSFNGRATESGSVEEAELMAMEAEWNRPSTAFSVVSRFNTSKGHAHIVDIRNFRGYRMAITKPRKKLKHGRQYVGSLIRTLSWEWVKFNHPKVAERIKAVAYNDCGLEPPKASQRDPHLTELLKKV